MAASARTGFYADPASPIASTPQRRARPAGRAGDSADVTLSPMHAPQERPAQRKDEPADQETWTNGLFSPVLKFFNGEDGSESEGSAPAAAAATAAASPPSRVPGRVSVGGGAGGGGGGGGGGGAGGPGLADGGGYGAAVAAVAGSLGTGVPVYADDLPESSPAIAPADDDARDEDYEYEYEEFNPYLFMKLLPAYSLVAPARPRIVLPRKSRKAPQISLVLDLDETLVHCSVDPIPDADLTFSVEFNGANYMVFVRKRPYLDRFLEAIYDKFEVTVFTASQRVYAEKLLDLLDPEKKYIKYRLYRDSCLNVDGNYLKDLNVLGRDLRHAILVDNSPHAFGYQVDNGIPIESWFDDPRDTELLKLASFLQTLTMASDVRPVLRRRFNVQGLIDKAGHDYMKAGGARGATL